jgi:uncharacterized membrane protein
MIVVLVIAIVIGIAVSGFTGFAILGWLAGGFIFLCGLPGALIAAFVHGEVSYAQDRADYRQMLSDIRAEEHECAKDARADRLIETIQKNPAKIYNDNRQVHFHGGKHVADRTN